MPNHVWLEFADGSYLAHLKNKRIDAVETATGANFGDIYARIRTGVYINAKGDLDVLPEMAKWKNSELVEIVRQGFIGGARKIVDGVESEVRDFHVNHLIQSYIDERPRMELWKLGAAIVFATMEGYEPGEAKGAVAPPNPETKTASSEQMDTPAAS